MLVTGRFFDRRFLSKCSNMGLALVGSPICQFYVGYFEVVG
jgi:hypothetical protein